MKYDKFNMNDRPEFLRKIKATESFTNMVMNSIYKLGIRHSNPADEKLRSCSAKLYRRLGFSLVLTSCILIASFFVPFLRNYQPYISKSVNTNITQRQNPEYKKGFAVFENDIKDLFGSITNSVVKIKEGK